MTKVLSFKCHLKWLWCEARSLKSLRCGRMIIQFYFTTLFTFIALLHITASGKELQDFVGGHQWANLGCCSGFAGRTPGCFECFETGREVEEKAEKRSPVFRTVLFSMLRMDVMENFVHIATTWHVYTFVPFMLECTEILTLQKKFSAPENLVCPLPNAGQSPSQSDSP